MSKEFIEITKLVVIGLFIMVAVIYFMFIKGKKGNQSEQDRSSIWTGNNTKIPEIDLLISTTNWLPGYRIEKMIGMDYYVVAQGAGLVSDWLAKWSDVFGTKSKSYSTVFEDPILYGYRKLMERAVKMGGNALMGVRHNVVAVPGDKSVIVFTFEGTVVVAVDENTETRPHLDNRPGISSASKPESEKESLEVLSST